MAGKPKKKKVKAKKAGTFTGGLNPRLVTTFPKPKKKPSRK